LELLTIKQKYKPDAVAGEGVDQRTKDHIEQITTQSELSFNTKRLLYNKQEAFL
jgi:hypothetical protein